MTNFHECKSKREIDAAAAAAGKRELKKKRQERRADAGSTENDYPLSSPSGLNYYHPGPSIVYCGGELFYYRSVGRSVGRLVSNVPGRPFYGSAIYSFSKRKRRYEYEKKVQKRGKISG